MDRKVLIIASFAFMAAFPAKAQSPLQQAVQPLVQQQSTQLKDYYKTMDDTAINQTMGGLGITQEERDAQKKLEQEQQQQQYDALVGQATNSTESRTGNSTSSSTKKPVYKKPVKEIPEGGFPPSPPSLAELQGLEKVNKAKQETGMSFDIRKDALKEAAVSYGARGGLAWRTYNIRREVDMRARSLDKVYNFSGLLIPAPSGMLIEPPIISESMNAMIIQDGGQQAAVSDRLYYIVKNARIVSTARTWRTYLERDWGEIEPPPDILRPENEEERKLWYELVAQGWDQGVEQADEIFHDDLNLLMADFQGMVRYRSLLSQGMVSAPYALQVDRGVTGGKDEMRIGDRAVQITGVPELITGSDQWQPANR